MYVKKSGVLRPFLADFGVMACFKNLKPCIGSRQIVHIFCTTIQKFNHL